MVEITNLTHVQKCTRLAERFRRQLTHVYFPALDIGIETLHDTISQAPLRKDKSGEFWTGQNGKSHY